MKSRHFVAYLRYQDTDADPLKMVLPPTSGKQFASRKLDQAVAYVLEHFCLILKYSICFIISASIGGFLSFCSETLLDTPRTSPMIR